MAKIRLQADGTGAYSGIFDVLRSVYTKEGAIGLFSVRMNHSSRDVLLLFGLSLLFVVSISARSFLTLSYSSLLCISPF